VAAGESRATELALIILYIAVAAVLVWVPVAVFVVAGARAEAWLEAARAWLAARQRAVTLISLLVFGGILVTDAVIQF
jgi:hypothetical protein